MTRQVSAVILWTGMALGGLSGCNFLRPWSDTSSEQKILVEEHRPKGILPKDSTPPGREKEQSPYGSIEPPPPPQHLLGPTAQLTGQQKDGSTSDRNDNTTVTIGKYPNLPGLNSSAGPELTQPPPLKSAVARAEPPPSPREPLVCSLEKFLQHQPKEAIKDLKDYDPESQEFFLRLLPVLAQLTQKKLSQLDHQETGVLYNQLENLLVALRSRSDLVIDEMCFCEHVEGFGVYKPLPDQYIFRGATPDQPGERVQIYVQLRNLCCEKHGSCYETRLSTSIEVVDQQGVSQWYKDMNDRNEPLHSQIPRHDYYRRYTFLVPHLRPGSYTLVVRVRDVTRPGSERQDRKTLPFRVTQ
jgi:hypothetical protein